MVVEGAVQPKLDTTCQSGKYRLFSHSRFIPHSSFLLLLHSLSLSQLCKDAKMKTHGRGKPQHRIMLANTIPPSPIPCMQKHISPDYEEEEGDLNQILKPTGWFVGVIAIQLEAISSVFLAFLSMVYESVHRAKEAKESTDEAVKAVPARIARGSGVVLRKLELGILRASHAFLVLVLLLVLAVFAGVGLVRWWAEEPVFLRGPLHFDYTEVHPSAVVRLGGGRKTTSAEKKMQVVPVGHTLHVTVLLLMPESDYNIRIGVFQLTAEAISDTGGILARSSLPCMMHFRSLPVRLIRTLVMAVPLLLGISCESQEVSVAILSYKEGYPKTQAIKVQLKARAGTVAIPELYNAEIIVNSQLPWRKQLIYSWRWTLYVWASLYIYISFLIILLCFMRPVIFPMMGHHDIVATEQASLEFVATEQASCEFKDERLEMGDGVDTSTRYSDALRRLRQRRRKRKAFLLGRVLHDPMDEGWASTSSAAREGTREDFNDSIELGEQKSELSSA